MERNLRVETIINKLLDLDIYSREMQEMNIGTMERIQYHHHKTVVIDTQSSEYDTDKEYLLIDLADCEHVGCHRVRCKVDPDKRKRLQTTW